MAVDVIAETTHFRFTMEDFDRLYEVGILTEDDRVEFLDGELIAMSPIGERHVGCLNWLNRALVLAAGTEFVVSTQNPIRIDGRASLLPDFVAFRAAGRRNRIPTTDEIILVIEIADSSRNYDRGRKFPRYAAADIPEAWLVDLAEDRIERHSKPHGEGYRRIISLGRGEALTSTVLPELTVTVDDLLGPVEEA